MDAYASAVLQPTNIFCVVVPRRGGLQNRALLHHRYCSPKRQMSPPCSSMTNPPVDALAEELPVALHISDLAGLSDADLTARLHYSAAAANHYTATMPSRLHSDRHPGATSPIARPRHVEVRSGQRRRRTCSE